MRAVAIALMAAAGLLATGGTAAAFDERPVPVNIRDWENATNDWGGVRTDLEEAGIDIESFLVYEISRPLSGGVRKHTSDRVLFDINMTFDLERIADLPGARIFAQTLAMAGGNGSDDVGDIQGFSNIAVDDDFVQLAELWFEQHLFDDRLRIKIGKVDANSEFAYVEVGREFIHSSPGFSPTLFVLPTFPDPAVSLNVLASPTEQFHLGLGVYNADEGGAVSGRRGLSADFDEVFFIAEAGFSWPEFGTAGSGRLAFGSFHHTGEFERFQGGTENGTTGFYAVADQGLWRENPDDPEDIQGLDLFLQAGWADDDVSDYESHIGTGIAWNGLIPDRDEDVTGFMVSYADLSDVSGTPFETDEVAYELFHLIRLTPFFGIKPDLQYISNPSGSRDIDDAIVATIRFELRF